MDGRKDRLTEGRDHGVMHVGKVLAVAQVAIDECNVQTTVDGGPSRLARRLRNHPDCVRRGAVPIGVWRW